MIELRIMNAHLRFRQYSMLEPTDLFLGPEEADELIELLNKDILTSLRGAIDSVDGIKFMGMTVHQTDEPGIKIGCILDALHSCRKEKE